MKQKIWIINHYAGNMFYEKGGRHYWIAKYLSAKQYEVSILCCNIRHHSNKERFIETKKLFIDKIAEKINTIFTFIKSTPYRSNGIDRIINMIIFYINVQKVARIKINQGNRPSVIIASSAHPLTMLAGIKIGKKYGIPCICEIRDLWPASIVAYNSKYSNENAIIKLLYKGEKWIYEHADALIFTMKGGSNYIVDKGWDNEHKGKVNLDRVYYINNGVDLDEYKKQLIENVYIDPDLDRKDVKKIVYTGSVSRANNVDRIVEIAKILKTKYPKIIIFIFGEGSEKERLKSDAIKNGITNLVFKGKVDKRYIPNILSRSDLNILDSFNDEICQYGISSNKLFEYIASGKPIITDSEYDIDIITKNHIGVVKPFVNVEEECDAIIEILNHPEEYIQNADSVMKQYDFRVHTDNIIKVIDNVISN